MRLFHVNSHLQTGAEIFWEFIFFILGIIFLFYGFNWRWRRFRWGWAVHAEEVGLKQNSWRGAPDAFAEHAA